MLKASCFMILTLFLTACMGSDPASHVSHSSEGEASTRASPPMLSGRHAFNGLVRLPEHEKADSFVVRDQQAYEAFVERIPSHDVIRLNPAMPSRDPLLKKPGIDFSSHILLVMTRDDTLYAPPKIEALTEQSDRLVVKVTHPSAADYAYAAQPVGIGCYYALLLPGGDKPVEFQHHSNSVD